MNDVYVKKVQWSVKSILSKREHNISHNMCHLNQGSEENHKATGSLLDLIPTKKATLSEETKRMRKAVENRIIWSSEQKIILKNQ